MNESITPASALKLLPLCPALPLPVGQTDESIQRFFGAIELEGAPKTELENYWRQDWRRFVYTYGLVRELAGSCLELGANPYFTTTLLKYFSGLDLTLANYFGAHCDSLSSQELTAVNFETGERERHVMQFHQFNTETAEFPFDSGSFDVVLFCEVLEHLQTDPVKVLREIKRVLRPSGNLVLTTPNVNRLENISRMLAGQNIYDPYSGYGPYGRHNREYNKHDLARLLAYCGFEVDVLFSADVHENVSDQFFPVEKTIPLVSFRAEDLGQYLFARARSAGPAGTKRPSWLYRSYPADDLE